MNSTYFGSIHGIGNLKIETIFYYMDEPILFTALDKHHTRYLCSCAKLGTDYLITKATNRALIQLMKNEITIRNVFQNHDAMAITWDGNQVIIHPSIPQDYYPEENAFLDMMGNEAVKAYGNTLKSETGDIA